MSQPESYSEFLQRHQPASQAGSLARFAMVFGVAFILLQWGYQALADSRAYHFYLEQLTVRPSAWLIHLLAPQDGVAAQGHRLLWPGGRLNVLNGCDGVEVIQLLLAAFIAASGTWRMRLTGVMVGVVLIYALNQARLVALYFAIRHDKALFEIIHGLAGPLVIIGLITLFFAWWIAPREPQATA